ncbi:hypothetical protein ABH966_002866 [Lysinibacillus sp. RC46]
MTLDVGTNEVIDRTIYNEVSPYDSGQTGYWSDTWDCLKYAGIMLVNLGKNYVPLLVSL